MNMRLKSKARIQIHKKLESVFEGIINPEKMTNYFISESTGNLESGKDVKWKFSKFSKWYPITEVEMRGMNQIAFVWDPETRVSIYLEPLDNENTLVSIVEGGKDFSDENLKWSIKNTQRWTYFLSCLKAYLEYGINLKKGAFKSRNKA